MARWSKLKQNGVKGNFLDTLTNFLNDRKQKLDNLTNFQNDKKQRNKEKYSTWENVEAGVPQDSILESLPF